MSESFLVESIQAAELHSAFSLLFQHLALLERQQRIANALQLVAQGEIALDNVLVIRDRGDLRGVAVCCAHAGAVGQIWPPQVRSVANQEAIEDALLCSALDRLRQAGSRFIQALLTGEDAPAIPCLVRAGFRQLSSLLTMSHSLAMTEAWSSQSGGTFALRYRTFTELGHDRFRDIMLHSYEGSLDFPELNDIRDVDDVLQAHRLQGNFHPEQWLAAYHEDQAIGLLLLAEMADQSEWELSYVGVVPEWRGKGFGTELVREALRRAVQLRASRLTVAVDSRNLPACRVYTRLGFLLVEEHQVYVLLPAS
jgi:ribosomal protein S18 acetylase RimI-like enzyme